MTVCRAPTGCPPYMWAHGVHPPRGCNHCASVCLCVPAGCRRVAQCPPGGCTLGVRWAKVRVPTGCISGAFIRCASKSQLHIVCPPGARVCKGVQGVSGRQASQGTLKCGRPACTPQLQVPAWCPVDTDTRQTLGRTLCLPKRPKAQKMHSLTFQESCFKIRVPKRRSRNSFDL